MLPPLQRPAEKSVAAHPDLVGDLADVEGVLGGDVEQRIMEGVGIPVPSGALTARLPHDAGGQRASDPADQTGCDRDRDQGSHRPDATTARPPPG
jgi:hypothetical protein